jgi:hypothetical protein
MVMAERSATRDAPRTVNSGIGELTLKAKTRLHVMIVQRVFALQRAHSDHR